MRSGSSRLLVLLDQGFFAASNFVLSASLAHSLSPAAFGVFGLVYAIFWIGLGLSRSFYAEVVAVKWPSMQDASRYSMHKGGQSTGCYIGVVSSLVCFLISFFAGGDGERTALFILSGGVLFAIFQDSVRSALIATSSVKLAVISDGVWLLVQVASSAVVVLTVGSSAPSLFALGWAGGAVVALLILRKKTHTPLLSVQGYLREHGQLIWRYAAEFLSSLGAFQLVYFLLAAFVSLEAVGAFRGAYTIVGVTGILVSGLLTAAVPDMARKLRDHGARRISGLALKYTIVIGFGLSILAVGWAVSPVEIGPIVLGATWTGASGLLLPIFLSVVMNGLAVGPRAGSRAIAKKGEGAALRLVLAPFSAVTAAAMLISGGGVYVVAWSLAVCNGIGCAIIWIQFVFLSRQSIKMELAQWQNP